MSRYRDDSDLDLPLDLGPDDDEHDAYLPAHPKPVRKSKDGAKRSSMKRSKAPKSRRGIIGGKPKRPNYTSDQRLRRQKEDQLYRRVTRPKYLLDLARSQGHLVRQTSELHGDTMQAKFAGLFATELPRCEAAIHEAGCNGELPALEIHHKRGRGPYLNDTSTFLGVCSKCHGYIESHPKWAKEEGLSERKNGV